MRGLEPIPLGDDTGMLEQRVPDVGPVAPGGAFSVLAFDKRQVGRAWAWARASGCGRRVLRRVYRQGWRLLC